MITSLQNPLVKGVRKLRNRKARDAEGRFLVEGITHVRRALEFGAPIESILLAPELLTSDTARTAVEEQRARGVPVKELGREIFESLTMRDHPSGLAAVVRIEDHPLTDLAAAPGSLFVALSDVGNPGNLGSIIRTADATGAGGLILVGDSTDPYHPQAVKASMGTMFAVPTRRVPDLDHLFAWCLMERVAVVATSAQAGPVLWDTAIPAPALFLFGSEATGLPEEALERADMTVRLPMEGSASSLNLAVAVGVVLYEIKRRSA